jgi:hypothetical protein
VGRLLAANILGACLSGTGSRTFHLEGKENQMKTDRNSHRGPYPISEGRGIARDYEIGQEPPEKDMGGPAKPLQPPAIDDIKNPHDEFAVPAPMTSPIPSEQAGPGPDQVGNSSGRGPVDPQGQQGGTEGGQPGSRGGGKP